MKKTILITGASGFIGSFLVKEFLNKGYDVYAAIRSTSSKEYLTHSRIKFLKLNFSNKASIKETLNDLKSEVARFSFIIHNAGVTKTLKKSNFKLINYQYTKNFVEALLESDLKPEKFLFISSLAAYGPGDEKSIRPIKESDIPNPVSLYGASKLKAEQYLTSTKDLPTIIIRPTGVYGPREKDYLVMYKTINKGIETYIGNSQQYLTFIYIKDLVIIIRKLLESEITNKSYFISDSKIYTSKEFSNILKLILNKKTISLVFPKFIVKPIAYINEKTNALFGKVPTLNTEKYKDIKCKNWICDSSQVYEDINYQPQYDLKQGLIETIKWYKHLDLL